MRDSRACWSGRPALFRKTWRADPGCGTQQHLSLMSFTLSAAALPALALPLNTDWPIGVGFRAPQTKPFFKYELFTPGQRTKYSDPKLPIPRDLPSECASFLSCPIVAIRFLSILTFLPFMGLISALLWPSLIVKLTDCKGHCVDFLLGYPPIYCKFFVLWVLWYLLDLLWTFFWYDPGYPLIYWSFLFFVYFGTLVLVASMDLLWTFFWYDLSDSGLTRVIPSSKLLLPLARHLLPCNRRQHAIPDCTQF